MKIKWCSTVLLTMLLLTSCSDTGEVIESQNLPQEYRNLISEGDRLDLALQEGRILALSSEQDRRGFETTLKEARFALLLLARNPKDKLGVQLGYRALKERERYLVGRGDMSVVDDFYVQLGRIVSRSAKLAGVDLGKLDWRLYGYRFSAGVAPFGVFSSGTNWQTGVSLDESYISVRGPENKAWLLSPSFDLTEVDDPSFRISHQTRVDQNDRNGDDFNRSLINREAFKAYVSTTYNDGDPNDAEWTEVDLGEMPASVDFHSVQSPKIDLSDFISPQTTVAIVMDADPDVIGSHYLTWSLSNFELLGSGNLRNVIPRHASLFKHEFNRSVLDPFQQIKSSTQINDWEPFGFSGSYRFAKIEGNGADGDNWLVSPKYPLRKIDTISLTIKETVRNPNFEYMQIMLSTNYDGGDPNEADWVELKRRDRDPIPPGEWADISTGPIDLAEYLGEEVVIGFRFVSNPDNTGVWEVGSLNFVGLGDSIRPIEYDLTINPPGNTGPSDLEVIKDFDFNQNEQGFTQEVVTGDPTRFELTTRNSQQYFLASGHQEEKVGRVRLVSPKVQLGDRPHVQIKHALNFYPSEHHDKDLIRIIVRSDQEETQLHFTQRPMGTGWDVIESEALALPQEMAGQEVDFVFEYGSEADVYPNWNIHQFKVLNQEDEQ